MKAKPAAFISKISVTETIKSLQIGKSFKFPTAIVKAPTIRVTARRLKRKGYAFDVTEANLINEVQVTRLR